MPDSNVVQHIKQKEAIMSSIYEGYLFVPSENNHELGFSTKIIGEKQPLPTLLLEFELLNEIKKYIQPILNLRSLDGAWVKFIVSEHNGGNVFLILRPVNEPVILPYKRVKVQAILSFEDNASFEVRKHDEYDHTDYFNHQEKHRSSPSEFSRIEVEELDEYSCLIRAWNK